MKRSKMGSEGIGSGGKYRSEAIRRLPKPTYEAEAHTEYKYCPYCGKKLKKEK